MSMFVKISAFTEIYRGVAEMPFYELGELFCGPGGIAYGAVTASIENPDYRIIHKWATDYDKDTCRTYTHNICSGKSRSVYCKDVRDLDMRRLADIDALAFGFLCNDFSVVGERKGIKGIYGPLYSYYEHLLNRS